MGEGKKERSPSSLRKGKGEKDFSWHRNGLGGDKGMASPRNTRREKRRGKRGERTSFPGGGERKGKKKKTKGGGGKKR